MISNNQPHTYTDQGRKFYYFVEHYDTERDGKRYIGFHTYIFDQAGWCWDFSYNTTHQYARTKGNGIFYQRTIWEADGLANRYPLDRDEWLDLNVDSAYALESTRHFTGLDLLLIKRTSEKIE